MQTEPKASGKPVQRESREQEALFRWRDLHVAIGASGPVSHRYPGIENMFAIPNGSYLQGDARRRAMQWARLKAQGAHAGVSDIFLPVPRDGFAGLWIELKAPKPHNAPVSEDQTEWINRMTRQGYAAFVAYGWVHAVGLIDLYYGVTK